MLHVFVYGTEVTNQGNGYSKHTGAFAALSPWVYDFCYMAFASGEHVAKDFGEVSVQLVYTGAYHCSINVDTLTRKPTGKMLQVGDILLTKSKRVHFIAVSLKDGDFPDFRFPRTLSKTFQSEKKSDNKSFQFYYFVICLFDVP